METEHKCSGHCGNCHHEEHDHNCNKCHHEIRRCPVCKVAAMKVPTETVESLTQMHDIGDDFYLCRNPKCKTVYFNHDYIFDKCDITTKVWYKSTLEDFIVCYCHDITLVDVIEAVDALDGCTKKETILRYLGKDISEKNCLHRNPTGTDCDKLLDNAIEFAKECYDKKRKGE